jgi:hypothetical protein
VPVLRVLLFVILDAPRDPAADLDHQQHAGAIAAQLPRDPVGGLRLPPPPRHRCFGQNRAQRCDVIRVTRADRHPRASQRRPGDGASLADAIGHQDSYPQTAVRRRLPHC